MRGVILHGGHGTRLRPLTHTGPKQLIPVANKPISQYAIEDLRDGGVTDIAIVLGDVYPEKVKELYGDGGNLGVRITYVTQDKPLGIAHAVGLCEGFVGGEPFVVYLGDNLLRGGIRGFVAVFESGGCDAMVLLTKTKHPERFGVAKFDEEGRLVQLVEKPKEPPSDLALVGVYFFRPAVFEAIKRLRPSPRGELEITEAIQLLLDGGRAVRHELVTGWWKDTGTCEDLLDANRLILDGIEARRSGEVETEESVQGRVRIDQGAVVRRGAVVRGPTIIGSGAEIGARAYIGPYTSVGPNAAIKRGEVENSIIMEGVLIDTGKKITDSIIGPHSEVVSGGPSKPGGLRLVVGDKSRVGV